MMVCSCAVITCHDIARAVAWMRAADPQVIITPGKVYRTLGKRPVCGGCARLLIEVMHRRGDGEASTELPIQLQNLRPERKGQNLHEGRSESHRISQPRLAQRADGDQPVLAALPAAE
ncbi:MAG: (2Fe-2S)-binding protein [Pseudomonadota bacterium]